jgi:hypothetical protein
MPTFGSRPERKEIRAGGTGSNPANRAPAPAPAASRILCLRVGAQVGRGFPPTRGGGGGGGGGLGSLASYLIFNSKLQRRLCCDHHHHHHHSHPTNPHRHQANQTHCASDARPRLTPHICTATPLQASLHPLALAQPDCSEPQSQILPSRQSRGQLFHVPGVWPV